MKQNLFWGAGYNFIAIPLAAGILAPIGIITKPCIRSNPNVCVNSHRHH